MRCVIPFLLLFLTACSHNTKTEVKPDAKEKPISVKKVEDTLTIEEKWASVEKGTSKDSVLSTDTDFINDFILKGKFKVDLTKYINENRKKGCFPNRQRKSLFNEFYNEGFVNLGDLNGDKKEDSVFVLPALGFCEEGDSYYFTDNSIPRILTDSNCCHPYSIFSIGDIDEDGGNEIAEYYSSCASNFKVFSIYTLKNNQWKHIKNFGFYYNNGKYEAFKDFHKMHRKIAKNKFQFLEIPDISNGEPIMNWETVIMK